MQKRFYPQSLFKLWTACAAALSSLFCSNVAEAQVVPSANGTGTSVNQNGSVFDIEGGSQTGANLFHKFDEFSVDTGETANFTSDSGVFNIVGQVAGGNPSYVEGQIRVSGSDANLYLVNPAGILFGPDAQISLSGSLTATTADQIGFGEAWLNVVDSQPDYAQLTATPSAFRFTGAAAGAIVNQGDLTVAEGELITLIAGQVVSEGNLEAPAGEIGLVAVGGESTVRFATPGSLLSIEVAEGSLGGGKLTPVDLPALLTGESGAGTRAAATDLFVRPNGEVELRGFSVDAEEVSVTGALSVRSQAADGGNIALLGYSVDVLGASVDAAGENGGAVYVGGGSSNSSSLPTSFISLFDADSIIRADGTTGAGGEVVVSAGNLLNAFGSISATGETAGGFVETSADRLNVAGIDIDARGQQAGGQWLVNAGEVNLISGVAGNNRIDPSVIESNLDAGVDVVVSTTSDGTGDISLLSDINQTGTSTGALTLTGRRFRTNGSQINLASTGQLTLEINQVSAEESPSSNSVIDAIAAIGSVNGDRLISLGAGMYDIQTTTTIDTDVAISGESRSSTILNNTNGNRLFRISPSATVNLSDLAFTSTADSARSGGISNAGDLTIGNSLFSGNRDRFGSAIHSTSGSKLSVGNSEFLNNASSINGGAISASDSIVSISDSIFTNNTSQDGGAIHVGNRTLLSVTNSDLTSNAATRHGGGIFVRRESDATLTNINALNNSASQLGGGLHADTDGTIVVADSIFSGNESASGGAIFAGTDTATNIDSTTFQRNRATDSGGGLAVINGSVSVTGATTFSENSARDGGGLLADNSSITLTNAAFERNTSLEDGGGIVVQDDSVAVIDNVALTGNTAGDDGGGVYATFNTTVSIQGAQIEDNSAADAGGGLYASGNSSLDVDNAQILRNRAFDGGGIGIRNSTVSVSDSTVKLNSATDDGGGLFHQSGRLSVVDTELSENAAIGHGGGVALTGDVSAAISGNTVLANNTTNASGGGIASNSTGTLFLDGVALFGNQSNVNGGGIFQGRGADSAIAGDIVIESSTLTDNIAGGSGGGLSLEGGASLSVIDTGIAQNVATDGGGLYISDAAAVSLSTSGIRNNRAGGAGGAIFTRANSLLSLTSLEASQNVAGTNGGAIALQEDSALSVSQVGFNQNLAGNQGGAVFHSSSGQATFSDVGFSGNEANKSGGAISATASSRSLIESSRFEGNSAEIGGGISGFQSAEITLRDSQVQDNTAEVDGGGVRLGADAAITIERSQISNNDAQFGGGLELSGGSSAVVIDSAFAENQATRLGGAVSVDGVSALRLSNSALTNNRVGAVGGPLGDGGGIFNGGIADLINTTISGNTAVRDGGAVAMLGPDAALTISNSTLTNNRANAAGGGISVEDGRSTAALLNSIVAGNTAGGSRLSVDVSGQFIDSGNNLIGVANADAGFTNSTLVGSANSPLDPSLEALADNGGLTKTHLLQPNSAAINAGRENNLLLTTDQRGFSRNAGGAVDIGAVEMAASELPPEVFNAIAPNLPVAPIAPTLPTNPVDPDIGTGIGLDNEPNIAPNLAPSFSNFPSPAEVDKADVVLLPDTQRSEKDADDHSIRRLEQSFGQSFEDYWNLSLGPDLSFDEVQAVLRRAKKEYEVNSAVIYAAFVPQNIADTGIADTEAEETPDKSDDRDDNLLVVEPDLADDDLLNLSLVMPEGDLVSYQLPFTRKQVTRQVRLFRSIVSDPADELGYQPFSQQVYQWLLAPLEADLAAQGVQNLIYALDAGLRTAPITAMRDEDGFSLSRFGISVIPNVGLMQADFNEPVRRSTVAMGVAEFESQAPLPAVPVELEMVRDFVSASQTVLNEGTTLEALEAVQTLEQPGALHLATHASFDSRSPESSYIQLWNDPLSMTEFRQLDWRGSNLELLILSACSTAMSSPRSGLGFAGLAAASGVDATVGSLWQVSDVGTLALMSEFYAQLEATDLRFEALRQAQLALIKGKTRIEDGNLVTSRGVVELPDGWDIPEDATLEHPFFWSAFTMVGNPW